METNIMENLIIIQKMVKDMKLIKIIISILDNGMKVRNKDKDKWYIMMGLDSKEGSIWVLNKVEVNWLIKIKKWLKDFGYMTNY